MMLAQLGAGWNEWGDEIKRQRGVEAEQERAAGVMIRSMKRMLLAQKAYAEGSFALCIWAAGQHDRALSGDEEAQSLLGVTTEVVKSWPSEYCLVGNTHAMQVLGGAGYVQDYPLEQLYRDQRLNMIHEGTAGIHALTLLGRKVQGGRAEVLFRTMRREAELADQQATGVGWAAGDGAVLTECATKLREAVDRLEHVTNVLTSGDREQALINAQSYMTLFGHTVVSWQWLR